MDRRRIIEDLCSKGHRGSTTGNERWAAKYIAERFRDVGLEPEIQEFRGHTSFPERLVFPLVLGLAGGVLALLPVLLPPDGPWLVFTVLAVLLPLLGGLVFYLESTLERGIFSRFLAKGDSRNVFAKLERKGSGGSGRLILLVAHTDTQKAGFLFSPGFTRFVSRFSTPDSKISPIHLMFLSILGTAATGAALRFTGGMGIAAFVSRMLHLFLMLYMIISLGLMMEWTRGEFVAGANDNASGVAVLLSLAGKLAQEERAPGEDEKVNNTDFWFLSTGCEETGLDGAFDFIERNGKALTEKPTHVIVLDGLGLGNIRYFTEDGMLKKHRCSTGLITACDELSKGEFPEARPFRCNAFTDGFAFTSNGFETISLACMPDDLGLAHYHWHTDVPGNIDYEALARAEEFVGALVEKISRIETG